MSDRHIIAIGGLLSGEENRPLIDYGLNLCRKPMPAIGFIATASGDAQAYRLRFEEIVADLNCDPSTLPLFGRTPDVAQWVAAQDVILVGGGNTKSMLAVWREWGLPARLHEAWELGTVLMGWSAGAICWFDEGVTDSFADRLDALDCLGFLPGSCCPHYSGETDRRPAYEQLVREEQIAPGIAIDDGAGVHFVNDQPHAIVALSASVGAYTVATTNGVVSETVLPIDRVELATM